VIVLIENRWSESYTLLGGLNEFLSWLSIFVIWFR